MEQANRIDVKTAVNTAIRYLQQFQDMIPVTDLRLEETEFRDSGEWLITLSTAEDRASGIAAALGTTRRNYKQFQIDATTGEVKSMKVRTLVPIA